jgi:predicted glycoside hydrolase/deacetylase ChbG (UPF0249 family)
MKASDIARRLGYAPDARLFIIHCDDVGMSYEANAAVKELLTAGIPTSCSVMMPCPWAYEFMRWYQSHPDLDVGIHVTLTSEWASYRWRPLTASKGLLDDAGFMHGNSKAVATHASVSEIRQETVAQIQQALNWGVKPTHIDTHMGTSLVSLEFAKAYVAVAREFGLPPMILEPGPAMVAALKAQGYDPRLVDLMQRESTPKLTALFSAAGKDTYDDTKEAIYTQLESLRPGITYLIIHPALESDTMRAITDSWQQRYWEYRIFMEDETREKIEELGIKLVTWRELVSVSLNHGAN